ncbi:protein kinase [Achlya hypogyna]|uniref:Protein kinase n=1 Tax=Achlya hypogyna TaxID=1202772 RepID=A0A1V9ZFJ4_ACHHY|nr:protein kinase [Achlya hypogyna]
MAAWRRSSLGVLLVAAAVALGAAPCNGPGIALVQDTPAKWCVTCPGGNQCVEVRPTVEVNVGPSAQPSLTATDTTTTLQVAASAFGPFTSGNPGNDIQTLSLDTVTVVPGAANCFAATRALTAMHITGSNLVALPALPYASLTSISSLYRHRYLPERCLINFSANKLEAFPMELLSLPVQTVTIHWVQALIDAASDLRGNPLAPFSLNGTQREKFFAMSILVDSSVKGPDAGDVASGTPGTPGLTSSAARDVQAPSSSAPQGAAAVSSWQMILLSAVGGTGLAVIIAMLIIRQRSAKDDGDSVLGDLDPAFATTDNLFLSHNTPMMVAETLKRGAVSPLSEETASPFADESDRCYRLLAHNELRLSRSSCPIPGGLSGSFDGEKVMIRRLEHRDRADLADLFVQRVGALSMLKHEHVVELVGASKLSGVSICAVFEHMEHGTLSSVLHLERLPLSARQARRMCADVAKGLAYLHSIQAHGFLQLALDPLATDLVLVTDDLTCKLNIVACLDNLENTPALLKFGSRRLAYVAPEVVATQHRLPRDGEDRTTDAASVYALGVILGEIVTRQRPYAPLLHAVGPVAADAYVYDMATVAGTPRVPPHTFDADVPPALAALVADCLSYDPACRPTAKDIVARLDNIEKAVGPE